MENSFESIIWLVIMVFFWLIPALTKKTKQPQEAKRQPYPQPPYTERPSLEKRAEIEKKILEALGFPVPIPPTPSPLPIPVQRKKNTPHPAISEKKPAPEIKPSAPAAVKAEEEAMPAPLFFNPDKLEEGIILSAVLGPPKSSTLLPGCWNGRQSGLKNR